MIQYQLGIVWLYEEHDEQQHEVELVVSILVYQIIQNHEAYMQHIDDVHDDIYADEPHDDDVAEYDIHDERDEKLDVDQRHDEHEHVEPDEVDHLNIDDDDEHDMILI